MSGRKYVFLIVLFLSTSLLFTTQIAVGEKPYEGVTVTVVTQAGPYIAGPVIDHQDKWTERTGGRVELIEIPYGDLYHKILTPLVTGTPTYDVIIVSATWLPDFVPYLLPLDEYIANPVTNPDWEDILPAFGEQLCSWGEKIYALPLDGDTHTLYYRRSIFKDPQNRKKFKQKYGYELPTPPQTMAQMRDAAEFFTGWDWNGDGRNDYGYVQPMARGGQAHWWFWNYTAPFSVLPGGPDKYHGSLYFDPETMEPLINRAGFLKGLELYKELAKFGPPGIESWGIAEVRSAMVSEGNVAMCIAWGAIPPLSVDPKFSTVKGDIASAPRPGATRVWNSQFNGWEEFSEVNPNRVPVLCFGGWVASVVNTVANADAAYDFIKFLNSPEISSRDVKIGETGYNPYRYSHLNVQEWVDAGYPRTDIKEFLQAVKADLENPSVMTDLRIPGKPQYVDTVLDLHVSEALAGDISCQEALDKIYEEWEKITNKLGREKQKQFYRTMLGLK